MQTVEMKRGLAMEPVAVQGSGMQTMAMKRGLAMEPVAVQEYCTLKYSMLASFRVA
jgi:hypothetical protein